MDNEQQATILALIITALKTVKAAREMGLAGHEPISHQFRALENDALEVLETVQQVGVNP